MKVEKDYYAILELPQSATEEEIKHAYRVLARRYHPDSRVEDVARERHTRSLMNCTTMMGWQ